MMRSDLVVLPEPSVDCDLSLFGGVEPFTIEHFSSKCSVEAFFISVLPWVAWIDEQRLDADPFQPVLEVRRNELRPVVRTYELRLPCFINSGCNASRTSLAVILGRTATHSASRVYSSNCQHFVSMPIAKLVVNEVDGPDMVRVCRPQSYDRTVLMIKPSPLLMPVGQLQAYDFR